MPPDFYSFIPDIVKKTLLTTITVAMLALSVNAQHITLHEEFTGENCDSCAAVNPGFWSLCDGGSNPGMLIHIAYMSSIPSAGTFYYQDEAISNARTAYYSISTTPNGRYDGHVPDVDCHGGVNPGYPSCFTQADINAEAALATPFTITAANSWNADYDSIITIVTITTTAKSISTTSRLRIALVETVDFATAPGTNGEKHFENVVRSMYPNALGTRLPDTLFADTTIIDTIKGPVPNYVNKSGSPFVVAWIQDDADQVIEQAAQAAPLPAIAVDAAIAAVNSPGSIVCATGGSTYSIIHSATLVNKGTAPLTSATIYYRVDSDALSSYTWSGSLAATASTAVVMPAVSTAVGADVYHTIYDSVADPNGSIGLDPAIAATSTYFFIENSTPAVTPFGTSFENPDDTSYYVSNYLNDDDTWSVYWGGAGNPSLAHTGIYAIGAPLLQFPQGEENILALPEIKIATPATTGLTFWEAYAQQDAASNDMLEVVYSSDCGATWTSIWSASGSAMATLPASPSSLQIPASPSQYAYRSISLSSITAGEPVILGFRFTQDGGNAIWIDDIGVHVTTAVQNLSSAVNDINLYPNPAKDLATLSFYLATPSHINIYVIDELGRKVSTIAHDDMGAGTHEFVINTASMSDGIYNVIMSTENGVFTKRLSVIK